MRTFAGLFIGGVAALVLFKVVAGLIFPLIALVVGLVGMAVKIAIFIAMLGSARATNEDNYVAQKFARVVVGTNNVDCCARVCHAPSAAALKRAFGAGLSTNSFDDIELGLPRRRPHCLLWLSGLSSRERDSSALRGQSELQRTKPPRHNRSATFSSICFAYPIRARLEAMRSPRESFSTAARRSRSPILAGSPRCRAG